MIVAVPLVTAVTRPPSETVATPSADVAHVTAAPTTTLPAASFTVATNVAVSPNDGNVNTVSDNSTLVAVWSTVTVIVSLSSPEVAVTVAEPSATDVTSPADDTVATASSDVAHVRVGPEIVDPAAFLTVAVSWAVSSRAKKLSTVSDSSRLTGTATVTEAVPFADPEVAEMVAAPSATEVTRPEEDTVATDVLDELHVTLALLIVAPFWSLTVADSCCVAPTDEKLRLVAESVIDVATGVGGVGGVGGVVGELPPSPHPRSRSTAAKARSLNINSARICSK